MNTSKVNNDETINFIYNSPFIEQHAKPNNALDFNDNNIYKSHIFHPLIKTINKNYLTPMEFRIIKKLTKLEGITETKTSFKSQYGFPRLLMHIHDTQLHETSKANNYQHYLNVEVIPPPLQPYMHTINNVKVSDVKDKCYNKIAAVKILGNTTDDIKPIVFGNNKNTLFAATKRSIKMAPIPDKLVMQDFIQHSIELIEKDIGPYLDDFGYSYAQWYNHLPAKKQKLIDPIYEYYQQPDLFNTKYTNYEKQQILTEAYQAICKAELQEHDGKPRMVCSIPQKYKYAMGPITWKLEEICSKYLQGYCGNKNLSEMETMINQFKDQGFTKVVEGDGSAFDNTQDITLKEIDRYLYRRIAEKVYHLPKDEFLRISQSYYKKMQVKYKDHSLLKTYITYYVLGTVFSGDCDTTLCNTIRMAMYNRYINDKLGLKYGVDYVVFSKGDDFSVLYKHYVSNDIIRSIYYTYFLPNDKSILTDNRQFGLGQICKFIDIGGLDSFKFCSLRSWYKNLQGDIILTRDPAKLYYLSKYSIKYKKYNTRQRMQYHLDLMISYLINYPNIIIFKNMAAAHAKKFVELYNNYRQENKNNSIGNIKLSPTIWLSGSACEHDSRLHLVNNNALFDRYIEFYDTTENEKFYKIDDNYWDTIKRLTQVHALGFKLTKDEITYINEQINNEFDANYILQDNDIKQDEVDCLIQEVFTLKNITL